MGFDDAMRALLGDAYPAYEEAMCVPAVKGLRFNPLKGETVKLEALLPWQGQPVPWCPEGRILPANIRAGRYALHAAGAYYLQEPSAMAPAVQLKVQPGQRVLDLCAAPGGKSGQLAAALKGKGLLIANEPMMSRARVLAENLQRLGVENAIVTAEKPQALARRFPAYFDRILVDAPCSGEGMFRRNPDARQEWQEGSNAGCALRQSEILEAAYQMLKPGGALVYSTCTFSKIENEQVCQAFLDAHADMSLEELPLFPGWETGIDGIGMRLYPHRLQGEGQFFATFVKKGKGGEELHEPEKERAALHKPSRAMADFFAAAFPMRPLPERMIGWGRQCFALPQDAPPLDGLKIVLPGLQLGEDRERYFIPAHALALVTAPFTSAQGPLLNYAAEDAEILHYLRGETFAIPKELEGWHRIGVRGFSIGWIKAVQGRAQNHLPKGLRMTGEITWRYA